MVSVNHVGIIMDGNRRFARSLKLSPWKGHEFGEKKLFKLVDWCKDLGIRELTVYAFSVQNLSRPKKEFDYLMGLFEKACDKLLGDDDFFKSGVKFSVVGDLSFFPSKLKEKLGLLVDKTKSNNSYFFNIALGYGGREEILFAMKRIAQRVEKGELSSDDIDEDVVKKNLFLSSEPDLIIRTGGDCRTSNFLPWQSIYSEWFFVDKKWPEFEKEDFLKCISEFKKRKRRFGK